MSIEVRPPSSHSGRLFGAARLAFIAGAAVGITSCKPDLGTRESLVDRVRILAIHAEPPEAPPGTTVTYDALVASPGGTLSNPITSWASCTTPKRLVDNGAVAPACVGDGVNDLGPGTMGALSTPIPLDACALFGPEVASADLRPRDPDVTGGYYQPIRVTVTADGPTSPDQTTSDRGGATTAFGFERVSCNLANAPADAATSFKKRYVANDNPRIGSFEARRSPSADGDSLPLDAVPRGARVELRVTWRPEDAETYAYFDIGSQSVVDRRESLRVSWFADGGAFDEDRTGRTSEDIETFTDNGWVAPDEARTTHLWIVLRDDRGGVSFASYVLATR